MNASSTATKAVFALSLALFAVAVVVYANAAAFSDADFNLFANFFMVAFSGLAVAALALVRNSFAESDHWKRDWSLLAAGFGLWFIAEVTWAFYVLVLGIEVPLFSLADVFWWLGYLPMAAGLYLLSKAFFIHLSSAKKILLAAAIAAAGLLVATLLNAGAAQASVSWEILASQGFYPLADLVLLALAAYIALGTTEFMKFSRALFMLATALVVWVVYDLWFAYANFAGVYDPKQFYDLAYLLAYVLVTAAAFCRAQCAEAPAALIRKKKAVKID
ncbi:MAG: hypothetical protein AB1626_02920 [Candidatus Micrarchaeota archaeon]